MKRIYTTLVAVLLTASVFLPQQVNAQAPGKMSYQAIIRNSSSQLVTSQAVGMQISILQGSATGTAVYVETQNPTTNTNGLVSLEIGTGTVVSGDFTAIDWANGPYFIKTRTDPAGGTNYSITGTSQLLSVPYALYAGTSANGWSRTGNSVTSTDFIGTTNNKALVFKVNNTQSGRIGNSSDKSTFLGYEAGLNEDLSDNRNTFIGYQAGRANTIGYFNTATGLQTLFSNTTGNTNTANGYWALYSNTTGSGNTANGYWALYSNTTGYSNTANGLQALSSNTTGSTNTATGYRALSSNTTGYSNVAIGTSALNKNTDRSNLVAIGDSALYNNGIGASASDEAKYNTAIGSKALYSNTTGTSNTANGYEALFSNTTGNVNIAIGYKALYSNTTGNNNTANGYNALYSNTTGNNNTALGFNAFANGSNYINSTALGYYASINASSQVRIGNNSVTSIGGYANWTNVSDARFKKDVQSNVPGLDFVLKLRPVTYHLDMDAIARFNKTPDSLRLKEAEQIKGSMLQTGFIAQEVEQAARETGYNFSGVDAPKNNEDYYGLRYAEFVVPLVKAVQEQQETIGQMQKENEKLKARLDRLEKMFAEEQRPDPDNYPEGN